MTQDDVYCRIVAINGNLRGDKIAAEFARVYARLAALEAGERDRLPEAVTEQMATAERIAGAGEVVADLRATISRLRAAAKSTVGAYDIYAVGSPGCHEPLASAIASLAGELCSTAADRAMEPTIIGTPSPDAPPLTAEQIAAIKPGDEVWQSGDPDLTDGWHTVLWRDKRGRVGVRPGTDCSENVVARTCIRAHRPARTEPAPEVSVDEIVEQMAPYLRAESSVDPTGFRVCLVTNKSIRDAVRHILDCFNITRKD